MNFRFQPSGKGSARPTKAAFTLIEILISLVILITVLSGIMYGYVQANWTAEWCSMSHGRAIVCQPRGRAGAGGGLVAAGLSADLRLHGSL